METKEPELEIETVTLGKRKRKPEREKKTITLFLQAHGNIISGQYIKPDLSRGCNILSVTGGIGRSGIMKRSCPSIRMDPPSDLTLPPDVELPGITELPSDVELPVIEIPGAQLDIMAMLYIQEVYRHINQSEFTDDMNIKSQLSFRVVVKEIQSIYTNCEVTTFPRSKIIDTPFNVIPAKQDKRYQLYPNEHEDCVYRGKCTRLGCELLAKEEQICPYYGVYVVYSTIPEDIGATLCGIEDNHTYSNLNTTNGETTKQYWLDKIEGHMDEKIAEAIANDRISDKIFYEREKTRIIILYEQMTRLLGDDSPISEEMTMETPLPEINLSQIIEIFKYGMGYDEINIIDPACDTCVYGKNPFKVLANKQLRIARQSRQNSKTTLGGKKHKTRKSKTPRKRKTYKKRKHIKMSYK
jgi:hypothetical protein